MESSVIVGESSGYFYFFLLLIETNDPLYMEYFIIVLRRIYAALLSYIVTYALHIIISTISTICLEVLFLNGTYSYPSSDNYFIYSRWRDTMSDVFIKTNQIESV